MTFVITELKLGFVAVGWEMFGLDMEAGAMVEVSRWSFPLGYEWWNFGKYSRRITDGGFMLRCFCFAVYLEWSNYEAGGYKEAEEEAAEARAEEARAHKHLIADVAADVDERSDDSLDPPLAVNAPLAYAVFDKMPDLPSVEDAGSEE